MDLPTEFVSEMRSILGSQYERFALSMDEATPVSIRINPLKCRVQPLDSESIKWCRYGYYLRKRPSFTFDPLFHAGLYYVQEASSMFVGYLLEHYVKEPVRFLDLCAAPGGKTTNALSVLPEGSFVTANEYVPNRASILAENIIKWGYSNCAVTNNAPEDYGRLTDCFDVMLVDAPCSGEGMFRKDPLALSQWTPESVATCAKRQKKILSDVWNSLRPGGLVIYSTCTYNVHENEEIAQYMASVLGAEPLPEIDIPESWGIAKQLIGNIPFYRFIPHLLSGEGFSVTIMQKSDGNTQRQRTKKQQNSTSSPLPSNIRELMAEPKKYIYTERNGVLYANRAEDEEFLKSLRGTKLLHNGIAVAYKDKGNKWQPHHSLAMSQEIKRRVMPELQLSLTEAQAYLRRESLTLPQPSNGLSLVVYSDKPLGFIKCVGSRANNLYPQQWRIRSGYTPDTELIIKP